ncbi:hypothetical protein HDU80_000586 [Chytriomyces hyalinus]|nr:hypothetical protein HDU80_000586 [Chytriomyces hyalinus]
MGVWGNKLNECSIGGLVDSFYEYLLKSSIAFSDEIEYQQLFAQAYRAIKIYMKRGDWHVDVVMEKGYTVRPHFHSLGAFWPGVKILAGDVSEVIFLPEAMSLHTPVEILDGRKGYPLRPEFVESLWVAYRATKNPTILETAYEIVDRLNTLNDTGKPYSCIETHSTRTKYGFVNVLDIEMLQLEDKMESFFLLETLKYLYLIFDVDNKYNTGNYVFNTEAHPFPVWSYHKTLPHHFESPEALTYIHEYALPTVPLTSTFKHQYRGGDLDTVTTGFRNGVCWISDWERGVGLNIDRLKGGMYKSTGAGSKGGKRGKKKKAVKGMKRRRKASEL